MNLFIPKIIFVEDEKVMRESMHRSLELLSNEVHSFDNALLAYDYYIKEGADLIMTDINLPIMNGFEFIEKCKNINNDIPFIILTAYNDYSNIFQALELQVEKLICKPVSFDILEETLKKIKNSIITKNELKFEKIKLKMLKSAIEQSEILIITDKEFNIIEFNSLASSKLLVEKNSCIKNLFDSFTLDELNNTLLNNELLNKTIFIKNRYYRLSAIPSSYEFRNDETLISNQLTFLLKDISDTILKNEYTIKLLYHDQLTKLENRASFFKFLNKNKDKYFSFFIIDIKSFSDINSFYGLDMGDNILITISKLLNKIIKNTENTKIYKLDSDRFGILQTYKNKEDFNNKLSKLDINSIISYLESQEYKTINNIAINILFSVGHSYNDYKSIFSETILALEYAKNTNSKLITFNEFHKDITIYEKHLKMQNLLKNALLNDNIIPFYQSIVDRDKNIIKFEALVRLKEQTKIYTPFEFLEVAKKSILYEEITKTMLRKIFEMFTKNSFHVSINLSFLDFENDEILNYIKILFDQYPNMKQRVTFELLESESFNNLEKTNLVCNFLKSLGSYIAIDDFGSGYSNFAYLNDLNIDILKIDASLVKNIHTEKGKIIIKNIINLAKELNCECVAEFIENETIFESLKDMNIDYFQGYYFDKPKEWNNINIKR